MDETKLAQLTAAMNPEFAAAALNPEWVAADQQSIQSYLCIRAARDVDKIARDQRRTMVICCAQLDAMPLGHVNRRRLAIAAAVGDFHDTACDHGSEAIMDRGLWRGNFFHGLECC